MKSWSENVIYDYGMNCEQLVWLLLTHEKNPFVQNFAYGAIGCNHSPGNGVNFFSSQLAGSCHFITSWGTLAGPSGDGFKP